MDRYHITYDIVIYNIHMEYNVIYYNKIHYDDVFLIVALNLTFDRCLMIHVSVYLSLLLIC